MNLWKQVVSFKWKSEFKATIVNISNFRYIFRKMYLWKQVVSLKYPSEC